MKDQNTTTQHQSPTQCQYPSNVWALAGHFSFYSPSVSTNSAASQQTSFQGEHLARSPAATRERTRFLRNSQNTVEATGVDVVSAYRRCTHVVRFSCFYFSKTANGCGAGVSYPRYPPCRSQRGTKDKSCHIRSKLRAPALKNPCFRALIRRSGRSRYESGAQE